MQTINIRGNPFPAMKAATLEVGMIYWDGSEITAVAVADKTVRFVLADSVERTTRATSLIALAHAQVAVVL